MNKEMEWNRPRQYSICINSRTSSVISATKEALLSWSMILILSIYHDWTDKHSIQLKILSTCYSWNKEEILWCKLHKKDWPFDEAQITDNRVVKINCRSRNYPPLEIGETSQNTWFFFRWRVIWGGDLKFDEIFQQSKIHNLKLVSFQIPRTYALHWSVLVRIFKCTILKYKHFEFLKYFHHFFPKYPWSGDWFQSFLIEHD